jgi:hypothetical protein
MRPKNLLNLMLMFVLTAWLSAAGAATLDAAYVTGKWEVNTGGTCGKPDAEYVLMRDNGTFEYGRRGKAEAVGFWRIETDTVMFEMLTSPATFQDVAAQLAPFSLNEIYSMQVMPIDSKQDEFSAVASVGDLLERVTLQRCK